VDTLWRGLAGIVVGVHYAYMGYLLVGGFLAWRLPRTIWVHAVATVWAVLIVTTKVPCPLTALQNRLRENAGERALPTSFIDTYVRGTLYPSGHQTLAQAVTAAVVIASWVGFVRRQRRHQRRPRSPQVASAG
jgi:hypothetical protein